jgi:hypothetical protein
LFGLSAQPQTAHRVVVPQPWIKHFWPDLRRLQANEMTKAEKKYMNRVAELPCVCCGDHGVHLHHIREGQGMAQRASNYLVVPLCPACHIGPSGVHGDKSIMRIQKMTEMDMLASTIEAMQ